MPSVDQMIEDILRREGGFVNHPLDRGGATNFGVTQQTLSRYLGRKASVEEVRNMSRDLAKTIYEQNYYLGPGIHRLPESIQPFVFDSGVNHGPRRAIRFVQNVCNDAGFGPIDVDGAVGPQTERVTKFAEKHMGEAFLAALIEERRNFYLLIVENNPSQEVFLRGWMNRIKEFEEELTA